MKLPALMLDQAKCIDNIARMAIKIKKSEAEFRPHFKTHQSVEIGNWFKEFGVTAINVSSVAMAEYFADAGWREITIAFPLSINEIERINRLSQKCDINILISAPQIISSVKHEIKYPVGFFIEMDNGYRRSGISYKDFDLFEEITDEAKDSNLIFKGFHCHPGNTYQASNTEQILEIHRQAVDQLNALKIMFSAIYPDIKISLGDTPSCTLIDNFEDLDIVSCGNFVFYDIMQQQLGVCQNENIAVALATTVVAVYPERNEMIVHAGAVHLSKEYLTMPDGSKSYGHICIPKGKEWGEPMPELQLFSISQEHGIIKYPDSFKGKIKSGDLVCILPVHSCLTAACMGEYISLNGHTIEMMKN